LVFLNSFVFLYLKNALVLLNYIFDFDNLLFVEGLIFFDLYMEIFFLYFSILFDHFFLSFPFRVHNFSHLLNIIFYFVNKELQLIDSLLASLR